MSIFSFIAHLFGGGIAKPIDAITKLIDEVTYSDEEMAKANANLEKIKQNPVLWDFIIQLIESKSRSVFVSGARPFIFWVIGISLALYLIPQFGIIAYLWTRECLVTHTLVHYPVDSKELIELLGAALSLYICRAFEKRKGAK